MLLNDLEMPPVRDLFIFGDTRLVLLGLLHLEIFPNLMTHLCFQAKIVPRFEMPDTNDPGRWTNRVVNNLLYYQTNYFVSALVIFFFIRLVNDTSKEEEYIQKL